MQKLQAEMTALFKKLYADEPKILVFGEGDPKARLVLIGEAPGFRCNATFSYNYTGKETHETLSAAEKKSCEFIFLDGQWKLNRLVGCTDENYAANSTAALDG